jgi:hypothetical protein
VARIRCSIPFVPAYFVVQTDTVASPAVGFDAASPNRSEDWGWKEEEGDSSRDDFHRVSFLNEVCRSGINVIAIGWKEEDGVDVTSRVDRKKSSWGFI